MSQPTPSGLRMGGEGDFPERVGIAGAGTIACGLAACVIASGGEVVVWARSPESAQRARAGIGADDLLTVTTDLQSLSSATLTVEAVAEEAQLKRNLLGSLRELVSDKALLATTT